MKKTILLVLVLALCFAHPAFAQDEGEKADKMESKTEDAHHEMTPPPALDNEFMLSFVGDWEGKTEGPMGTSADKVNYEMGMDGQFLLVRVESKAGDHMMKGMGAITMDKDGNLKGYWIDNSRTMAEGAGMIEDNKITMTWTMDHGTYTRVQEKVDDNTFTVVGKMVMGDGPPMETKGTMTRVKDMTAK